MKNHTIQISDKFVLPTTPKGLDLNNHYGADPEASPYGPQPTLQRQEAWILDKNGNKVSTILTKIIHTSKDSKGCDISTFQNFQMCLDLEGCDLCSAAHQCGWCETTKRCLPGDMKAAQCASACSTSGWNFNASSCKNSVKSGYILMSHDATKLIQPELTAPKTRLTTTITHRAVVRTPVLLGTRKYKTLKTSVDQNGNVVSRSNVDIEKPIVGEVHQVMNVDTVHH